MMDSNKLYSWIIGTGIVLFAIHNPYQPLLEYAFLPQVGMLMMVMGIVLYTVKNYRSVELGDRRVWIPMVIIAVSIAGSGFAQMYRGEIDPWRGFAPAVMGALLFLLYLSVRQLNRDVFTPFTYAVVIGSLGCVIYGVLIPGRMGGGIISPTNWDMATGLLVFGTVVSAVRRQWWLSAVALVGLFFTGSAEAVFVVGVVGLVVLIRRDFSRKMLVPLGAVALVAGVWFGLGYGQPLYQYALWAGDVSGETLHPVEVRDEVKYTELEGAVPHRWRVISETMADVQPLGHGYYITEFVRDTPHNVPVVIVNQVGPVAGVAWLWVTAFCFVKTRYKYAFSAVIALSVFDHYIWTQVAPWWWCLVGVATANPSLESDLIFRGVRGA